MKNIIDEEEFPGHGSAIPNRLALGMANQPLSMLLPKNELVNLINPNLNGKSRLSLNPKWILKDIPDETTSNALSGVCGENISSEVFETLNNTDVTNLVFKRPALEIFEFKSISEANTTNIDMYEGLSDIAKKSISSIIDLKNIKLQTKESTKRKSVDDLKREDIDTENDTINNNKRVKLVIDKKSTNIQDHNLLKETVISSSPSNSIESLQKILKIVNNPNYEESTYWTQTANSLNNEIMYTASLSFIDNIQTTLQSILNFILSNDYLADDSVSVKDLISLLNICLTNIESCTDLVVFNQRLALKSIHSTFMLLQLDFLYADVTRTQISPDYINKSLSFISSFIQEIFENPDFEIDFKNLTIFQSAIMCFNQYLNKKPILDEDIVTKILYSFLEIILNGNDFGKFNGDIKTQACWDNIKYHCTAIYVYIFENYPTQRDFTIELILPSIEKIPSTKSVKKLFKVGNSNSFYMSYFTFTLLSLIQSTTFSISPLIDKSNEKEFLSEVLDSEQNTNHEISTWCDQISDEILKRVFANYSSLKNSLEIYCNDLISCISQPEWCSAEYLLTSLTKKLLYVFNPSNLSNVNTESLALSLLSNIGSVMLDIKIFGENNDNTEFSLVSLCNYPDRIKKLIDNFDKSRKYLFEQNQLYANNFLWTKELSMLTRLLNLKNKDQHWCETISRYILEIAKNKNTSAFQEALKSKDDHLLLYYSTIQCTDLQSLYEPYLKLVLSLIDSNKIRLRSGAVKCFSALIAKDKTMIDLPMIQETIDKKLRDSSASVKDNILDIIGKSPNIEKFYKQVNINYNDDSLSVRKHILNLNKSIYENSNNLSIRGYVLSHILKRNEDEEDFIVDLSRSYLLENLFLKIETFKNKPEKQNSFCQEIIKIISSIILSSDKCYELFYLFFNFYVLNDQIHTQEVYSSSLESIKVLTKMIISEIVNLQQDEGDMANVQKLQSKELLSLLCVIASSDGSFITREQLSTLYPFLSSIDDDLVRYYTLRIFNYTLSKKAISLRPKFLFDMETYILSTLPKFSNKELDEAIPIAWSIAKERRDTQRVARACFSCLKHLSSYIKVAMNEPSRVFLDGKLQRLLYMSTGFARYCDIKNENGELTSQLKPNEKVYEYVAKCLLVFAKQNIEENTRRVAIKNLANLCSSHANLFNSNPVLKIFDLVFREDSNVIKTATLESFYMFFTKEEQKILKKAGVNGTVSSNLEFRRRMKSTNTKTEKFNDGICSALVTRYLNDILDLCLSEDQSVSNVATKFLGMVDSYSYANPSHYIHCIMALFISPSFLSRKWADKILSDILIKFETMIFSCLLAGIKSAINYNKRLHIPVNVTFLHHVQLLIGNSKSNKTRVVTSIFKSFQSQVDQYKQDTSTDFFDIFFLCSNILNIEFEDKLMIYKFMKKVDVNIQEVDEQLELIRKDSAQNFEQQYHLIVLQNSLLEFRACMFKNFVLNEDTMFIIGTDEQNDLKNSPLSMSQVLIQLQIENITYGFDPKTAKNDIINKYWSEKVDIDI